MPCVSRSRMAISQIEWRFGEKELLCSVGRVLKYSTRNAIAAEIVVVRSVQGHVQIADEMNDKTQGISASRRFRTLVFEYGKLLGNRLSDTAAISTIFLQIVIGSATGDIDVVPGASVGALATDIVGPSGCSHEKIEMRATIGGQLRVDWVFAKQFFDKLLCFGSEILFSDEGDGLMPLASPSAKRSGSKQESDSRENGITMTEERIFLMDAENSWLQAMRRASERWVCQIRCDRRSRVSAAVMGMPRIRPMPPQTHPQKSKAMVMATAFRRT